MSSISDLKIEIKKLQEQIQLLQSENQHLRIDRVVAVVQQKEVYPKNYDNDMKRLKVLERENKKMHKLMEFGNISSLESLISEYKAMSKVKLDKIVQEYQFYYTNRDERMLVRDFIDYLQAVETELQKFLFISRNEVGESK